MHESARHDFYNFHCLKSICPLNPNKLFRCYSKHEREQLVIIIWFVDWANQNVNFPICRGDKWISVQCTTSNDALTCVTSGFNLKKKKKKAMVSSFVPRVKIKLRLWQTLYASSLSSAKTQPSFVTTTVDNYRFVLQIKFSGESV